MEKRNYQKESGYAAQKKYITTHPEAKRKADAAYSAKLHKVSIAIPKELKPTLDSLTKGTGMTAKQLFLDAVEEKYGVILHKEKN